MVCLTQQGATIAKRSFDYDCAKYDQTKLVVHLSLIHSTTHHIVSKLMRPFLVSSMKRRQANDFHLQVFHSFSTLMCLVILLVLNFISSLQYQITIMHTMKVSQKAFYYQLYFLPLLQWRTKYSIL